MIQLFSIQVTAPRPRLFLFYKIKFQFPLVLPLFLHSIDGATIRGPHLVRFLLRQPFTNSLIDARVGGNRILQPPTEGGSGGEGVRGGGTAGGSGGSADEGVGRRRSDAQAGLQGAGMLPTPGGCAVGGRLRGRGRHAEPQMARRPAVSTMMMMMMMML